MLEKLYARYARLIASDDIVIVIMPKHFTCCRCHKRCKSDPAQRRPVQSHLRTQTENDLGRPLEPGDVICSACRRRLARIKDLAIDVQHQHKDTIDPDYQPPAPFSASIIKSPKSIQLQINSTPRNHKNCVICKKPSGHRNHHVVIPSSAITQTFVYTGIFINSDNVPYFNNKCGNPDITAFLLECSAMDPRFKTLPYITDNQKEQVYKDVCNKALLIVQQKQQQIRFILTEIESENPGCSDAMQFENGVESKSNSEIKSGTSAMDDLFGDIFITKVVNAPSDTDKIKVLLMSVQFSRSEKKKEIYSSCIFSNFTCSESDKTQIWGSTVRAVNDKIRKKRTKKD
ncbi:hypothetical protein KUTeg_007605 [Tegillarca granosa]|uniref:Uncharacterized protein n=1 Tax=Tegillarca granosa TaxID=220873 RepID=A0ABQ9FDR3_TEGGR|nr:hypothetical protein KUTeg_007605 [Tegillarca granosa]